MSEKPKGGWFRFHLLTAVLMTSEAGLLIGANLTQRGYPTSLGWPFSCTKAWTERHGITVGYFEWYPSYVALDAVFALTAITATGLISELIIRRREARRR